MTNLLVAALQIELLAQDGKPPTEFRIFRKGAIETAKGTFQFSEDAAAHVLASAQKYKNDFAIDYGHAMHAAIALDPAQSGKAAGWFKASMRDGELWANDVKWTPKAATMLADREYRYISPVFGYKKDSGEIAELHSVALTNIPATFGLDPLMASRSTPTPERVDSMLKLLIARLGLKDDASEADVLAALEKKLASAQTQLVQLTGKATDSEQLAVLMAWKVAAEQVPELTKRLVEVEEREKTAELTALLTQGKREGKIPPAYEAVMRTWSTEQVKQFLSVAIPLPAASRKEPPAGEGTVASLSASESFLAKSMGVSPEQLAQTKARRGGAVATATKE